MMSRTYIVEQTFTPSLGQAGDWSSLWRDGIPSINAYIATTPKETAEVALWTPDGDPLLARWPYGSGRTVAWTSDLNGKWSSNWVQWPALPKVLVEWVKWMFPQFESAPYSISTQMDGSEAKLRVRAAAGGGPVSSKLAAGIQTQAGTNELKRLMPVAPGEYEAGLSVSEPGVYLAQIGQWAEGASIQDGITAGFVIPYSPEYRIENENGSALLDQVAATTGGRVLNPSDPKLSFQFNPIRTRQAYDWTRGLFITALMLWLFDIAIRRLSLPWARMASALVRPLLAGGKLAFQQDKRADGNGAASSPLSRLKERTAETNRFYRSGGIPDNKENGQPAASSLMNSSEHPKTAPANQEISKVRTDAKVDSLNGATINRLLAAKNKNKR